MVDARLGCFDPKARIFLALISLVHFHASDSHLVLCLVADASGVEFTRHPCQLNNNALIQFMDLIHQCHCAIQFQCSKYWLILHVLGCTNTGLSKQKWKLV